MVKKRQVVSSDEKDSAALFVENRPEAVSSMAPRVILDPDPLEQFAALDWFPLKPTINGNRVLELTGRNVRLF